MRTAVLVSGQMRTLDKCAASIREHVMTWVVPYDVYVHAAADEDAGRACLLQPAATWELLRCASIVVAEQPFLDEKNYIARTGRGVAGVQRVLRQLWALQQVWRMVAGRYDWYIRLRPDTECLTDLEQLEDCDPDSLYVPEFCNWWGLCDRFAFGGHAVMERYCNQLDRLDEYIALGGIFHPETFLRWCMNGTPIRRTKIRFNTLRKDGSRIVPEFHADKGDVC